MILRKIIPSGAQINKGIHVHGDSRKAEDVRFCLQIILAVTVRAEDFVGCNGYGDHAVFTKARIDPEKLDGMIDVEIEKRQDMWWRDEDDDEDDEDGN